MKSIDQKPASHYFYGALAVMVRYNQAEKCPETLLISCYKINFICLVELSAG